MHFFAVTTWRHVCVFINVMPSKPLYLGRKRRCSVAHNNGSGTPNKFSVRENMAHLEPYYDRSPPINDRGI